jgi:hypothetical protein
MIFWYLKSPRGMLGSYDPRIPRPCCTGIAGISSVLTHSRPSHLSLTVVLDSIELHDAWDERCEKGVTSTMEETKLFFKLNERFETFEYT